MAKYLIRCPYRVDEPTLGFEEHEIEWGHRLRIDPTGALLVITEWPETKAFESVVRMFAPGAWTEVRYLEQDVPIKPLDPDLQSELGHHGPKDRDRR